SRADELPELPQASSANDALQGGCCTPGQICSAAGVLQEAADRRPSVITDDPPRADGPGPEQHDPPEFDRPVELTDEEIRERMSGNLCRCGAYVGIVDALRQLAGQEQR